MATKNISLSAAQDSLGPHSRRLLHQGHAVRVFDNLSHQVHGGVFPSYLSSAVEFIEGNVRDPAALTKAVVGSDVIYHLAAAVGVAINV